MNQPSHTHPSPLLLQLQDQLLRTEQQYFEQLDQQAQQLERCNAQQVELTQTIKTLDAERTHQQEAFETERQQWQAIFREAQEEQKALTTTLETERQQWQAIFREAQEEQKALTTTLAEQWLKISQGDIQGIAQQAELTQAIKTLEAERQQWQAIFREAQEEQKALANALAEQRLEISLSDLQLRQAQEELATTLALQQELEQWQQKLEMSLQRQLNLMVKTLMLRCMDQLRWLLPMAPLRRFKVGIQRLLRR